MYKEKFDALRDEMIREIIAEMGKKGLSEFEFDDRPCVLAMPYNDDSVGKVYVKSLHTKDGRLTMGVSPDYEDDELDEVDAKSNYFIVSAEWEHVLDYLKFEMYK